MSEASTGDLERRLTEQVSEAVQRVGQPQPVPVNMYATDKALVIVAPLCGVMADDVEVVVERGRVLITASMRTPAPKEYILHEWHYGPYERTVEIPSEFAGPVASTFGNGQLVVQVARGEGGGSPVVVHPTQA